MSPEPYPCSRRKGGCDAPSHECGGDASVAAPPAIHDSVGLNPATRASLSPHGDEASPLRSSRFDCMDAA